MSRTDEIDVREGTAAPHEKRLTGIGVSPGIAIGPAYIGERGDLPVKETRIDEAGIEAERARFAEAVAVSAKQLRKLKTRATALPGQRRGARLQLAQLLDRDRDGLGEAGALGFDLGFGDPGFADRQIAALADIGRADARCPAIRRSRSAAFLRCRLSSLDAGRSRQSSSNLHSIRRASVSTAVAASGAARGDLDRRCPRRRPASSAP